MQHGQRLDEMTPSDHFAYVVDRLCALLFAHSLRATALFVLMSHRLRRAQRRFASLAAKVAAGTVLPPLKPRILRTHRDAEAAPPPPRPLNPLALVRVPSAFAWLRRIIPDTSGGTPLAGFGGGWLDYFVNTPRMQPLIAAAPDRVGRILRPIARMLGTTLPAALQLPPRKRARRAQPEARSEAESATPRRSRTRSRRAAPRLCDPPIAPAPVAVAAPPAAPAPSPSAPTTPYGVVTSFEPPDESWRPANAAATPNAVRPRPYPPPRFERVWMRQPDGTIVWFIKRRTEL